MKKGYWVLTSVLLICAGCMQNSLSDNLDITPDKNVSADTTTVAPVFDVSVLNRDSLSWSEFNRTVQIIFTDGGAQITGDMNNTVTASGNHVTVKNTTDEKVIYELKGTTQDGSVKLYGAKKLVLVLDGLELTNPQGAAINNQGKKCHVVLKGTNNLTDGVSYDTTPDGEDEKAALFSEGGLVLSGDGTLTVTARGKSGITSDDYVHIMDSPVINVSSVAGHGIRGKDAVYITNGTVSVNVSADMKKGITSDSLVYVGGGETVVDVTGSAAYDNENAEYKGTAGIKADCLFLMNGGSLCINNTGSGGKGISGDMTGSFSGGSVRVFAKGANYGQSSTGQFRDNKSSSNSVSAKGIKFDGNLFFAGGSVTVDCASNEGIESKGNIIIDGGSVYSYSAADDAMNSAGTFAVVDGYVCGYAVNNDGLDANGNFYIKGGVVYAIGKYSPEVAIDANTEGGYKLYISGGTVIAIGGLESGAELTQECYQSSVWNSEKWYSMTVGSDVIAFMTPSSGGTPLVVSGKSVPLLKQDVTVQGGTDIFEGMLKTGATVSGGSEVFLESYTGGAGIGMNPGGGGFNPGGGGFPSGGGGRPQR